MWLVAHGTLGVSEMLALVHGQAAGTTAEAVALGSKLAAVTLLAKQLAPVLASVGAVQPLVAKTANEAGLVPLVPGSQHLLGGIDRLAALGALGMLDGLERHLRRQGQLPMKKIVLNAKQPHEQSYNGPRSIKGGVMHS